METIISRFQPLIFGGVNDFLVPQICTFANPRFKANVNHEDAFGFAPLGACKTPEDIDLLIRHRAEVNKSAGPLHVTPLCLCCWDFS